MPRLTNPYVHSDEKHSITCQISEEVFQYFDRKLSLPHGWVSAVVCQSIAKLHEHCVACGVADLPEIDFEPHIVAMLEGLTFKKPKKKK